MDTFVYFSHVFQRYIIMWAVIFLVFYSITLLTCIIAFFLFNHRGELYWLTHHEIEKDEQIKKQKELFIKYLKKENLIARKNFPDQEIEISMIALTEETGELAKAILEHSNVYEEAVQVASMAMRIATEYEYVKK